MMEKILWKIYKAKGSTFSLLLVLVFFGIGWVLQNYFKIIVKDNIPEMVFGVIATSLITLVAFVGVVVIFGFERISRELKQNKIDKNDEPLNQLKVGWENAWDIFMEFAIYTFFVVILNLFLLVFHKMNDFTIAILLGDIALIGYSFHLVIRVAEKVLGIPKQLLNDKH